MKKIINMALVWLKSLRPNLLTLVQPQEELPKFNLIIIGSAKCGTTSLNQYLKQHPDVYLSSDVGINNETGLFLNNSSERIKSLSNKRIRQYLNDKALQKAITKNYRGEKILAEESTDYTKFPFRTVNHKLIKQQSKNLKLLFIIRDLLERFTLSIVISGDTNQVIHLAILQRKCNVIAFILSLVVTIFNYSNSYLTFLFIILR